MPFLLADPGVMNQHCINFRIILEKYVNVKTVAEGKIRRTIAGERFGDLVYDLSQMMVNHFRQACHPVPRLAYLPLGASGTMANFDPGNWQVAINIALVCSRNDLPIKFAPVVFSSIYHEYRHAEQFSLMIRYVWAQHPAWLRYQNMVYNAERNHLVLKPFQVPPIALEAALNEWKTTVTTMGVGAIEAMILRSLSTVGGERVSAAAVASLALYPLSTLRGCSQEEINRAALWFQSRFRTWVEEFGGRASLLEMGRMFDLDETGAANLASGEARLYGGTVDKELQEWNATQPTGFPGWPVSSKTAEGRALDGLRRTRAPFNADAMRACRAYLTVRREAAIDLITATQGWYEGVPLEADTHALERQIQKALKFSGKLVDTVAKDAGVLKSSYLPPPKDWTLTSI